MKIAIAGFGRLGSAVLNAAMQEEGVSVVGVFSRREAEAVAAPQGVAVYPFARIRDFSGEVQVVLNCMGSARDLPKTTPLLAQSFNVVDTFDTHSKIAQHIENVSLAAKAAGTTAIVSTGWDPGLFSLARAYMKSVMKGAALYTFWGKGASQGHSDAIKELPGVILAREYTIPISSAVESVRRGTSGVLEGTSLHRRVCYVVADPSADTAEIERQIKTMPEYFEGYETTVNFVDIEEFLLEHKSMAHAGNVIALKKGTAGTDTLELSLSTASNPDLTAGIMLAYARACLRMNERGETGCVSVLDVRASDLLDGGAVHI